MKTMRYKLFGKSGLRVSEICLGAMTFGEEWGWGASAEESRRIFSAFTERGGNFIDTANVYTNGTSEKFVGDFIAAERERFVIATKYTCSMRKNDPNAAGNHRKNLVQSLEASLKRLKCDYVDLYWVHAWDEATPIEETLRALDDVVRAGKVLYVGISDAPAWIVSRAHLLAELRGWSKFVGLQIEYSLIERTPERELLPMARALDLAVTPWGPLGGGVLSGKYDSAKPEESKRAAINQSRLTERNRLIVEEVKKIGEKLGKKPTQVALAWLRRQMGVIIPIVGARTAAQLQENLEVLDFSLDDAEVKKLDEVSRIELGFPHDFLAQESVRQIVYGGTYGQFDNHRTQR
jgi:aryl-alcohol dehydrogenase-like predicted oxidoreductase